MAQKSFFFLEEKESYFPFYSPFSPLPTFWTGRDYAENTKRRQKEKCFEFIILRTPERAVTVLVGQNKFEGFVPVFQRRRRRNEKRSQNSNCRVSTPPPKKGAVRKVTRSRLKSDSLNRAQNAKKSRNPSPIE